MLKNKTGLVGIAALLCAALFGLMTGIADGQREGWNSDVIVIRLTAGVIAALTSSSGSSIPIVRCSTSACSRISSFPQRR